MVAPLTVADVSDFLPQNQPSLTQQERTAFSGVDRKLRNWMVNPRFKSMLSFDHKQDGIDYFVNLSDGVQAQAGDQFISTGAGGAVDGDTGEPSYWLYAGATWSWMVWDLAMVEFTPDLTTASVGNGLSKARFMRQGREAYCDWYLQFGSTSTLTGGLIIDFPGPSNSPLDYTLEAYFNTDPTTFDANITRGDSAHFVDAAPVTGIEGMTRVESATTWRILRYVVSGATIVSGGLSSTVPITWTTDDVIMGHITYDLAN